jgi:hypothetical protein
MVVGIVLSFTMRPDKALDDVASGAEEKKGTEPASKFV